MISDKAKAITEYIYRAYGTDSGYLFGILPACRSAIEAVVQCTVDVIEDEGVSDKDKELAWDIGSEERA